MKSGMERLITRRKLRQTDKDMRTGYRLKMQTERVTCVLGIFLHVVYVTRIRHLLDVDARLLLGARHRPDDALLNNVLQVGEPTPDVAHVLKRVGARTRVPVPELE